MPAFHALPADVDLKARLLTVPGRASERLPREFLR